MKNFDLIIIGAGPGGLAACQRMSGEGLRVALVDVGKRVEHRERHAETDMTTGHGGAGLFSDGKFSFFPSASELWMLPHQDELHSAYAWTCDWLTSYGLDTPPFPVTPAAFTVGSGEWVLKDYPSDYISLDARLNLTADMVDRVDATIIVETEVLFTRYSPALDSFRVGMRDAKGAEYEATARRLIFASGRFGPIHLGDLFTNRSFQRLEVGFRIEQPAERAFFRNMQQLDPKLRFRERTGDVEWRTFCACRNGEAVLTRTLGMWTVSGRSDCPPTGYSNIGFNTRILDEGIATRALPPMLDAMADKASYFTVGMNDLVGGKTEAVGVFDRVYGKELRTIMVRGLMRLAAEFPEIHDTDTRLIGPTLEGIGWYPKVDGSLRLLDSPAWVVGDACGLFRGIVAALISGYYAASLALRDIRDQEEVAA